MARLAINDRVHVGADGLNAYLVWRRQTPVTVGAPGTIVACMAGQYLVKLDKPLPTGNDGPARVVRNTVNARGSQLTRLEG